MDSRRHGAAGCSRASLMGRACTALILGACLAGCGILGLGDEEYLIRVDSLSVPETVLAGDSIPVRVQ